MRTWVKWCVKHDVKFLIYLVWALMLPLYIAVYVPEAFRDWMREKDVIKGLKK